MSSANLPLINIITSWSLSACKNAPDKSTTATSLFSFASIILITKMIYVVTVGDVDSSFNIFSFCFRRSMFFIIMAMSLLHFLNIRQNLFERFGRLGDMLHGPTFENCIFQALNFTLEWLVLDCFLFSVSIFCDELLLIFNFFVTHLVF